MTVHDLIEHLKTFDPNLPVCYKMYSEQCLLSKDDLKVEKLCKARTDEWVHNARPDKELIEYLVFPGN